MKVARVYLLPVGQGEQWPLWYQAVLSWVCHWLMFPSLIFLLSSCLLQYDLLKWNPGEREQRQRGASPKVEHRSMSWYHRCMMQSLRCIASVDGEANSLNEWNEKCPGHVREAGSIVEEKKPPEDGEDFTPGFSRTQEALEHISSQLGHLLLVWKL